ncbi:MAG: hypothetical protein ACP5H3_03390 [Candidatus Aenigmatarchaeota archaeon]|jgi:hypothetical protein
MKLGIKTKIFAISLLLFFGLSAFFTLVGLREISEKLEYLKANINPNITVAIEPKNSFWNETELNITKRECSLLCSRFDFYIPVVHTRACMCCNELPNQTYFACYYWSTEE